MASTLILLADNSGGRSPSRRNYNSTLAFHLANVIRNRIFAFRAERLSLSKHAFGPREDLIPDASNLAEVLNILQSDRARFDEFRKFINAIFPDIREVRVTPRQGEARAVEILISEIASEVGRSEIAFPISESGTGVGQVMAILYVVIHSKFPRILIIDEPQSFLHPGAVRKLFDILKLYPQHQYIVTTHSPIAVTSVDASTLLLLTKHNSQSEVAKLDAGDTNHLRNALAEVGARLSDVFGADNLLWVEGQTEERCFPLILSKVAKLQLMGTVVLGVLQTGDFRSKDKTRALDIYKRLSQGKSLLPPALGFVFDQEDLSPSEKDDLIRSSRPNPESPPLLHFIPRRMYENYLLNPRAIAHVLSDRTLVGGDNSVNLLIEAQDVMNWLEKNKWRRDFLDREYTEAERTEHLWLEKVNGTKLLKELFKELSKVPANYEDRKVAFGVALTTWLVENEPQDLQELADFLKDLLEQKAERL